MPSHLSAPAAAASDLLDLLQAVLRQMLTEAAAAGYLPRSAERERLSTTPLSALPMRAFDLLMRTQRDDRFPHVQAVRYDRGPGSARIAPDGSPGVPYAWVRYFDRAEASEVRASRAREADGAGAGTIGFLVLELARAEAWLEEAEPHLASLYGAYVAGTRPAALARLFHLSPAQVSYRLRRARTLLLARLAWQAGMTDNEDLDAVRGV